MHNDKLFNMAQDHSQVLFSFAKINTCNNVYGLEVIYSTESHTGINTGGYFDGNGVLNAVPRDYVMQFNKSA